MFDDANPIETDYYDEVECGNWFCKGFKYADNAANVQS